MTAPLRYSAFRYLTGGRIVSTLGNAMAPIALAFAVLDLTGSPRDLGLVVGARSLTNVVFLLVGGVVADRFPRHLVMVTSSVLACVSQGAVAVLVLTHSATIPALAGLAAVNGLVASFAFPAASALQGQTVPGSVRRQANAIARLGVNAALILGAAAGGILVAGVGPGWGIAADALSFAIAGALFSLVRVADVRERAAARSAPLTELRHGFTEFAAHTWLWVVVVAFCFLNAAIDGSLTVLGPVVANESFGRRAWGIVLAAQTAGMFAGGLVALRIRVHRLLLVGCVAMLGEVPVLVALGVTPRLPVLLVCAFVAGLGLEQFAIAWDTSLQEHIAPEKLARVYSYDALGSFLAIPVGQVAAGPVAAAIGTRPALLAAAGIVALSVAAMVASREVRTLRHRPAPAQPPAPAPAQLPAPAQPPAPAPTHALARPPR
jgi:MFS family permease